MRRFICAIGMALASAGSGMYANATEQPAVSLDRKGVQWDPLEWILDNPSYDGNPFDLDARVTFFLAGDSEQRTTGMFYAGNGTWKFRFTATRPGRWTFTTRSTDSELDGHSGTIQIAPDPDARGFVTHQGNKWARYKGADGRLETFIPQFVMYEQPHRYFRNPDRVSRDINTFIHDHGFTGFHTPVYCRWFDIEQERCENVPDVDPNPDPRTFEALEMLIGSVHAAGGVVHIWMWGDESRTKTPRKWDINGAADKRLQRYIAARLAPLPGWTMGYGFDLWEWVTGEQLSEWRDYLQRHSGWQHMLGARADKNGLTQLSEDMDYASYEQYRPGYASYVKAIDQRPGKPAFSEDRFRIRRSERYRKKDYSMKTTRRGLWHSALAGGVANIWGNLVSTGDVESVRQGSWPYPRPEWIKTCSRFFARRFLPDLKRDNDRIANGYALRSQGADRFIFYREDASEMTIDLSGMSGPQPIVAVDALVPYHEISLGMASPGHQTIDLGTRSDWAVAVGSFADDSRLH